MASSSAVILERFWAKVIFPESGCWDWVGPTVVGYGQFYLGKVMVRAHRFAYELTCGPIPKGLTLDHLCRRPRCVNPAHLEAVTIGENVLRGIGPTAANAAKTHCKRGHEFSPGNTYHSRLGRECRVCRRAANVVQRAKRVLKRQQERARASSIPQYR